MDTAFKAKQIVKKNTETIIRQIFLRSLRAEVFPLLPVVDGQTKYFQRPKLTVKKVCGSS